MTSLNASLMPNIGLQHILPRFNTDTFHRELVEKFVVESAYYISAFQLFSLVLRHWDCMRGKVAAILKTCINIG